MARTLQDIWKKWEEMVDSKATYRFSPVDDEDDFEPFEGVPVQTGTELAVELKDGKIIWIDVSEFCFMEVTKV